MGIWNVPVSGWSNPVLKMPRGLMFVLSLISYATLLSSLLIFCYLNLNNFNKIVQSSYVLVAVICGYLTQLSLILNRKTICDSLHHLQALIDKSKVIV